jgi:hypothetical protein
MSPDYLSRRLGWERGNLLAMVEDGRSVVPPCMLIELARLLELDDELVLERGLAERRHHQWLHRWLFGPEGRLHQSSGRPAAAAPSHLCDRDRLQVCLQRDPS